MPALQDVRIALRSLRRSPGFTLTALLSLTVGIAAGATAFGVLDAVRFRDLPFPDARRLLVLSEVPADPGEAAAARTRCRQGCDVSYDVFANVLQRRPFRTLDVVAGYTSGGKALQTADGPVLVTGGVVSPNLFSLLQASAALGRTFLPEDDKLGVEPVVLLGHQLWAEHFGSDPAILGRTVQLSDTRYTIIGVMPPGFRHEVESSFWLPAVPTLDPSTRPSIRSLTVIARLAPGATLDQVRAELAGIDPVALAASAGPGGPIRLEAAPLRTRYTGSTQGHDVVFAAVVACVLLIAVANLINLVLVRAVHQRGEFAVRAALGARSGRLVAGLVMEQLLLVGGALALGMLLARPLLAVLANLDILNSLRPGGMEYRLDVRAAGFAVVLAVVMSLLLGAVPAAMVRRLGVDRLLREGGTRATGGRRGVRFQSLFVVAQVASAVVLLAGAGLVGRTVLYLTRLDPGFQFERVIAGTPSYPHPWRVPEKYVPVTREILRELGTMPGVATVAARASVPLATRGAELSLVPDGRAEALPRALVPSAAIAVTPGYFTTLGIQVARGRPFDDRDHETGAPVALVNEWAAERWWPGADPVGRTVRLGTAESGPLALTIIGVVRDNYAARPGLILADPGPELYRPLDQAPSPFPTFLVLSSARPAELLRPVRDLLVRQVPERPVFATLMADQVSGQLSGARVTALQILVFAMLGLGLAMTGLYGVLAYTVGRRIREIGIRGALGASRGRLRGMVLRDAAVLAGIGVAIGVPVAVRTGRLLDDLLHGTAPGDPVVLASVATGVLLVALGAAWLPATRAARVDPVVALRDL